MPKPETALEFLGAEVIMRGSAAAKWAEPTQKIEFLLAEPGNVDERLGSPQPWQACGAFGQRGPNRHWETRKIYMETILEARRAVLTVATALVASTIASAAVITGMMAVIHGGAATPKSYSSYWTTVTSGCRVGGCAAAMLAGPAANTRASVTLLKDLMDASKCSTLDIEDEQLAQLGDLLGSNRLQLSHDLALLTD
jgi:hypothetical protein